MVDPAKGEEGGGAAAGLAKMEVPAIRPAEIVESGGEAEDRNNLLEGG